MLNAFESINIDKIYLDNISSQDQAFKGLFFALFAYLKSNF